MNLPVKVMMLASGVAAAGSALLVQAVEALRGTGNPTPSSSMMWALGAGVFGAGTTWGLTKSAIATAKSMAKNAHDRISEEKVDREKSVDQLREEMNRGFSRLDQALSQQTSVILSAVASQNKPPRGGL